MKTYLVAAAFTIAALFPGTTAAWTITNFASDITIQEDGNVLVTETIAVDFASEEKHGIYRDIPITYQGNEGRIYTTISDITVTQDHQPATVQTTENNANVRIRIGDADTTISGEHTYRIMYRATGVLRSFDSYDELYWNVTGNEWDAPIQLAQATITVPAEILKSACYKGPRGATTQCDQSDVRNSTAVFSATNIAPGHGLTAAIGFTPDVVTIVTITPPPTIGDALTAPFTLALALLAALTGIFFIVRHWWRYGRDRFWQRSPMPGVRSDRDMSVMKERILPLWHAQSVAVEYESPDNLRPAEIGVLLDESADTLDVSATIIDLASRGLLEITEVPKTWLFGSTDYTFTRTGKKADGLLQYEQTLLDKLFDDGESVNMSDLKNSFYTDLATVKKELYAEVVRKKLFADSPKKIRLLYVGLAFAVLAVSIALFVLLAAFIGAAESLAVYHMLWAGVTLGLLVSSVALLIASPFMPRKTGYGRELYQRARGYKEFVSGTEKYRARFYEDEGLFVAVLPYAIMFGVTDKLATAFKEMGIEPKQPAWYHGTVPFNPAIFATSMNDFSQSLGTAMASAPSSSGSGGGGFSGGGFGGGGGGSW